MKHHLEARARVFFFFFRPTIKSKLHFIMHFINSICFSLSFYNLPWNASATVARVTRATMQTNIGWLSFFFFFETHKYIYAVYIHLPSLFIPIWRHFLRRHAWHWLRWALSTTQRPVPAWHLQREHKRHEKFICIIRRIREIQLSLSTSYTHIQMLDIQLFSTIRN